jgi:predicted phage-related endonuclease
VTLEELQARQHFLGSSDAPALLNVDKYKSLYRLWLEKTGQVELDPSSSLAARIGTWNERGMCDYLAEQLETRGEYGKTSLHPNGIFRSQHDVVFPELNACGEGKTFGMLNPTFDASDWGAENTNNVPFKVLLQTQFSLLCSGYERCHVIAFFGGHWLRKYVIERDEELCKKIQTIGERFWSEHVLTKTPPPDTLPTFEEIKDVKRSQDMVVAVDEDIIIQYANLRNQKGMIEDAIDIFKRDLLLEHKDAAIFASPKGTLEFIANARGVRSFRLRDYKEDV